MALREGFKKKKSFGKNYLPKTFIYKMKIDLKRMSNEVILLV